MIRRTARRSEDAGHNALSFMITSLQRRKDCILSDCQGFLLNVVSEIVGF
jgi:hypothetical protein